MRQSNQINSEQADSLDFDVNLCIGVPDEVRSLLSTSVQDRGTASDIGMLCAALMVKHMGEEPMIVGMNRIGVLANKMAGLGGGYTAGFFSILELVIAEGAKHIDVDGLAIRAIGQSTRVRRMRAGECQA